MEKKPRAESIILKQDEAHGHFMENDVADDDIADARHDEVVMYLRELIGGVNSMQRAMREFNMLLDKHFKITFHMEVVSEKLSGKVDRILESVTGDGVVENSGGSAIASTSRKANTLTHPALIQLRDALQELDIPEDKPSRKFHNAFVKKYNELLLYFQKHNTSKVTNNPEYKTLYEFVKNQKTNIRNYKLNNEGPFAKEPRYMKFLKYLGVEYVK